MERRSRHGTIAALAMVAIAAGTGCASSLESQVTLPTLTMDSSTVQMTGMATGTLVEEGGCIRLTRPDGSSRLVIWPEGTRFVDDSHQRIAFPNGKSVTVGQSVTLGGGERSELAPSTLASPASDRCTGPYFVAADRIQ